MDEISSFTFVWIVVLFCMNCATLKKKVLCYFYKSAVFICMLVHTNPVIIIDFSLMVGGYLKTKPKLIDF
ncbi:MULTISPECIES: hypothetical protein [Methanolobus]|jgi:hypothetical protein|uniref:hypothetical protein n=1 Tax=Methanolobus TaxID=2220 RepID=UPI00064F5A27|nr:MULTISPECIES: hypothetical protein [Methanolobus]